MLEYSDKEQKRIMLGNRLLSHYSKKYPSMDFWEVMNLVMPKIERIFPDNQMSEDFREKYQILKKQCNR